MSVIWDASDLKLRTHLILGAGVAAMISSLMTPELSARALMTCLGAICSLLPDIDTLPPLLRERIHRSRATHSLGASLLMGLTAAFIFTTAHSLGLSLSGLGVGTVFAVAFASTFSHAASDAFTRTGVLLLWPVSNRRFYGRARYDGPLSNSLLILLGVLLMAYSLLLQ